MRGDRTLFQPLGASGLSTIKGVKEGNMETTAAKFANELRTLIGQEEQKIIEHIATGYLDHTSYQRYVGSVQALRAVIEMFDIAQANAEKF